MSLKLSDTRVYEPQIRARLGTTAHFGTESVTIYAGGSLGVMTETDSMSWNDPEAGLSG